MKLIIEDDEGRKTVIPVVRDEITIGRNDADDEATLVRKQAQAAITGPHPRVPDTVPAPPPDVQVAPKAPSEPPPPPRTDPDPEAEAKARKHAETATIRLSDLRTAGGEVPTQDVPEGKRPKLVGISGTYRTRELILDRTPIRLGRSDENDVEIDHPSISRTHCRMHLESGIWKVMDAE